MSKVEAIITGLQNSQDHRDWALAVNIHAGIESKLATQERSAFVRGLGTIAAVLTRLPNEKKVKAISLGRKFAEEDSKSVLEYFYSFDK